MSFYYYDFVIIMFLIFYMFFSRCFSPLGSAQALFGPWALERACLMVAGLQRHLRPPSHSPKYTKIPNKGNEPNKGNPYNPYSKIVFSKKPVQPLQHLVSPTFKNTQ